MKYFVIILSILIFCNATFSCGSALFCAIQNVEKSIGSLKSKSCQHACCVEKTSKKSNKESDNDDQKCNCTIAKVLNYVSVHHHQFVMTPVLNLPCTKTASFNPIIVHSYDYHAKISYPPQI